MDNLIGKRLDGRYSIESLVGVGGMANVYRGTDLKTGNQIAVKVLKDEFLDNEELVRRFKNESKAISILSHPNIEIGKSTRLNSSHYQQSRMPSSA